MAAGLCLFPQAFLGLCKDQLPQLLSGPEQTSRSLTQALERGLVLPAPFPQPHFKVPEARCLLTARPRSPSSSRREGGEGTFQRSLEEKAWEQTPLDPPHSYGHFELYKVQNIQTLQVIKARRFKFLLNFYPLPSSFPMDTSFMKCTKRDPGI